MTEKNLGTVLKEIRKGKGLSQAEVCGDFISRVALSKIENNINSPSYRSLIYLLDKLDLSLAELEFLLGNHKTKEAILFEFWSIPDDTEKERLAKVVDLCETYQQEKGNDPFIADLQRISEVMLSQKNLSIDEVTPENQEKLEKVWDRLNQMDGWTLNELKLATAAFVYFPIETAQHVAERIVKEATKYEAFDQVQPLIAAVYLNLTTLYIKNNDQEAAIHFNEKTLTVAKKSSKFDYYYFCLVRKGFYLKDTSMVEEGLFILRSFGNQAYIKDLEEEKEKYWDLQ